MEASIAALFPDHRGSPKTTRAKDPSLHIELIRKRSIALQSHLGREWRGQQEVSFLGFLAHVHEPSGETCPQMRSFPGHRRKTDWSLVSLRSSATSSLLLIAIARADSARSSLLVMLAATTEESSSEDEWRKRLSWLSLSRRMSATRSAMSLMKEKKCFTSGNPSVSIWKTHLGQRRPCSFTYSTTVIKSFPAIWRESPPPKEFFSVASFKASLMIFSETYSSAP